MPSGRQYLINALTDFTQSLAAGLGASAQYPGKRGERAGMAAALAAPFQMAQVRRQQQMEEEDRRQKAILFQETLRSGKVKEALDMLQTMQGRVPGTTTSTTVPMAPYLSERPAEFPGGPTQTQVQQPEGQRPITMESSYGAPIEIPGYGQVAPISAIGAQRQAADALQMQEEIKRRNKILELGQGQRAVTPEGRVISEVPPPPRNMDPLSDEGMKRKLEFEQNKALIKTPVPGRDIPLSPEVEAQRKRMNMYSNPLLNQLRQLEIETKTSAVPGQVIFKATGNPVPPSSMPEAAAQRIAGFETALQQSEIVAEQLAKLGDTGAIKGYVMREGVYWPVVQDKLTPEQASAVAETQRLVNSYIYAVSGKQINEQEMVRIAKTAPDLRFTKDANVAIAKGFKNYLKRERDNYLKVRGWAYKEEDAPSGDFVKPGGALDKLLKGKTGG